MDAHTDTDDHPNAETGSGLGDWLALLRVPGIGPAAVQRLLGAGLTPRAALGQPEAAARTLGLNPAGQAALSAPDWPRVERDLAWLEHSEVQALTLHDARYPPLLREIHDPPPLLFVRGDPTCLLWPQLALVGSRNPSHAGRRTAHAFAHHLAGAGLAITSGLALGVDAAGHEGALDAGGVTVAVAGTGLDAIYPARHRPLADRIVERGALVSEFPPGTPPSPANFPRRNRIISGLSLGTLVVEAALRSGSLITARLAMEQGREVFAIPGSIHNPLARGCHALIRQGAKLVETGADIMEELGALYDYVRAASTPAADRPERADRQGAAALDKDQRRVLAAVDHDPTAVDTVVERSGLTPETVCSMLLVLELHGFVASNASGHYCRATDEEPE
ncbi:MAG TPA: DNA-processing protein DprA [Gammaproteobacteria bacterium]|nr:DNA-processing protein DprA [Gammaproteobacteria bacterium]